MTEEPRSRTAHSITTYEALSAELAAIQRLGYAVDRQELNLGVWCVAAPVLGVRQTRPAPRPLTCLVIITIRISLDEIPIPGRQKERQKESRR